MTVREQTEALLHPRSAHHEFRSFISELQELLRPEKQDRGSSRGLQERGGGAYNATRRSRSALEMTETELNVIAALAMIGLSSNPKKG